jgi:membrane-associated phospholipid phosphatase
VDNKRLRLWLLSGAVFATALLICHVYLGKAQSFQVLQNALFIAPAAWEIITFFGDGLAVAVLFPALWYMRSRQAALALLLAWLLGTLAVQGLKNTVFKNEQRPIAWFENVQKTPLRIPDGIATPYRNFSFPSGHTATAFSIWGALLLFMRGNFWSIICCGIPVLVGLSRIVLMQHFPIDVGIGALIGTASVLPALWVYKKWSNESDISLN